MFHEEERSVVSHSHRSQNIINIFNFENICCRVVVDDVNSSLGKNVRISAQSKVWVEAQHWHFDWCFESFCTTKKLDVLENSLLLITFNSIFLFSHFKLIVNSEASDTSFLWYIVGNI